ncbi:hypothetical protein ACN38_g4575 [Penicillium nordicum]|uniref:Uncharacterized protein n=1 Tax=Penicillium nordicum TaxID=229535 RepID=A0A0M8P6G8_9EURO|nr:hypothetical protein ACN38_g4575 [Penicillium nordicum]
MYVGKSLNQGNQYIGQIQIQIQKKKKKKGKPKQNKLDPKKKKKKKGKPKQNKLGHIRQDSQVTLDCSEPGYYPQQPRE